VSTEEDKKEEELVLPITPDVLDTGRLMDIVDPESNPDRTITIFLNGKKRQVFLDVKKYSDRVLFQRVFKELKLKAIRDGALVQTKAEIQLVISQEEKEKIARESDFVFFQFPHSSADIDTLFVRYKEDGKIIDLPDEAYCPIDAQTFKGTHIDKKYIDKDLYAYYEHCEDDLYIEVYRTALDIAMIYIQTKTGADHSVRFFNSVNDVEYLNDFEMQIFKMHFNKLIKSDKEIKNLLNPQNLEGATTTPSDIDYTSMINESGD
jgi:hypothetical protein